MALIPLYRDLLSTLEAVPAGVPVWPTFAANLLRLYPAYFDGLAQTYGPDRFGPAVLPGLVEQQAPALRQALAPAPSYGLEAHAAALLELVAPLLPGPRPDIYLGTLFFTAPAATLAINGRPAIALGLERFHPSPPAATPRQLYHPAESAEMIPHEAAHCARMKVLGLPPTPQELSLLEMVMLEGTALIFTDLLLHKQTLATFMPAEQLAWHEAHEAEVRQAATADLGMSGMEPFFKYFSTDSPISGYYVGYSLCREFLRRFGPESMPLLIAMPSAEILRRLSV